MEAGNNMKVGILVDPMASVAATEEEEYEIIKASLTKLLPEKDLTFYTELQPFEAINRSVDIFVLDFGGLMPGAGGLLGSMVRQTRAMLDHLPSCLLVLWTLFTADLFKDYPEEIEMEADQFFGLPNVVLEPMMIYSGKVEKRRDAIVKLRTWCGLETTEQFLKEIV